LNQAAPLVQPALESERLRLVADTLWRLGKLQEAEQAYGRWALAALTSGEAATAREWQARLQFLQAQTSGTSK